MTGRIGGSRVSKDDPFIEACGSLDELNAAIGLIRSHSILEKINRILQIVQDDLFTIGADISNPEGSIRTNVAITEDDVRVLEREIDSFEESLPPLKQFILPGGGVQGAVLHWVRTVARRAERHCVSLAKIEKVNPFVFGYLNRLSDLLFVMARYANLQQSISESNPAFGKNAGKSNEKPLDH
jgi:cob(I)alamin adenosyltransferase